MFYDTEVILRDVLKHDTENKGVTYEDIRNHCDRLKQSIFDEGKVNCLYFGISKQELDNAVQKYPHLFRTYGDRYYRGVGYSENAFCERT